MTSTVCWSQAEDQGEPLEVLFYNSGSPARFIIVEKKYQRLKLFEQTDRLKLIKEFPCATGENPGTKKTSGDARTPEGIYHITEIYEDKRITVFGSRAFHLDYPNVFDTHAGHQGDGIFIHGTNKKLLSNSTNGCITLNNSDLDELAPYLTINGIPVIILDTYTELSLGVNLRLEKNSGRLAEILDQLWLNTERFPIEQIETLSSIKNKGQAIISIAYKTFDDKDTQYNERKRAYLSRSPRGNWRTVYAIQSQNTQPILLATKPLKSDLVTKSTEPVPKPADQATQNPVERLSKASDPPGKNGDQLARTSEPRIKATEPPTKTGEQLAKNHVSSIQGKNGDPKPSSVEKKQPVDKGEELFTFVEKWRTAWTTKDLETYMNFYSPTFKSGILDRDGWRAKKEFLNQKYKYIQVNLKNIKIERTASGATVSFYQSYRSDQIQANGKKILHLVNRKNHWLIEHETM